MSAVPTAVTLGVTYAPVAVTAPLDSVVTTQALTLTDPTGANTVTVEPVAIAVITLELTVPGVYTASLQAQDQNGSPLGAPVSASFSIAAVTTVTLNLPSALTATVAGAPAAAGVVGAPGTPTTPASPFVAGSPGFGPAGKTGSPVFGSGTPTAPGPGKSA